MWFSSVKLDFNRLALTIPLLVSFLATDLFLSSIGSEDNVMIIMPGRYVKQNYINIL